MINPFNFKKEEPPARKEYAQTVSDKARILINELVLPLPAPNQHLINEILDLITTTASMPSNLVNKEAVLQNAKQLLVQLIEPIPEPNHALVNELVQLITQTVLKEDHPQYKPQVQANNQMQNLQQQKPSQMQSSQQFQTPASMQQQTQAQTTAQQTNAQAQTQQQSVAPATAKKEDKTVLNLILEQIKELITVTGNLNDKLKKLESRIEGTEAVLNRMKEKVDTMDTKIATFEKNIEKFIGLYEVVTNQYNPFVESAEELPRLEQQKPKLEEVPKKQYALVTREGNEIHNLYELLDELINMDKETFIFHVGNGRNDFSDWVREVMKHKELADELSKVSTKADMVKAITKKLN